MASKAEPKKTKTVSSAQPVDKEALVAQQASEASMLDEAMALNMLRDPSVLQKITRSMRTTVVSMGLNLALAVVLFSMALRPVSQDFYWTTGNGTVYPMLALDQPVLSESERTSWVTSAVTNAFNMDFNNINQRVIASHGDFTKEGFKSFKEALITSGLFESIVKYKYRLSAVPSAPVVQVGEGEIDGIHGWQYQLPMLLTYESGDNKRVTQPTVVQLVVVRVRENENPRGMAIARFQSR